MDKKLRAAFDEAWSSNAAMLSGDARIAVMKTAIKAIVERDYIKATDADIDAVIAEGIKEMEAAGVDFTLQTKMML